MKTARCAGSACLGWGLAMALIPAAVQAAPKIDNLSARSLVRGSTTTITIQGSGLRGESQLLLSAPIASQKQLPGGTPLSSQWEIALAPDAPIGVASLRIGDARGISNAVLVGIDDLPITAAGPNIAKLPASITTPIAGNTVFQTTFTGKKGDRVAVDVQARRIGSKLDPVLELLSPNRVPIVWSQGKLSLGGDARVEAVLPADGEYTIEVHDALYNAPGDAFFCLKVGDLKFVDLTFPLGGRAGSRLAVELIGNIAPTRVPVFLEGALMDSAAKLPTLPTLTGSAPRILVDDLPQFVEGPRDKFKLLETATPTSIQGRLDIPGEDDRYRLRVQPGQTLRFDVTADRAGSSLDGVLTIRDESGKDLAAGDDRPGTKDPGLDYAVPAGVSALVVSVADLHGRGGPSFPYRLTVEPVGIPDFSLSITDDRRVVSPGGAAVVRVRANRAGYNGAIQLVVLNLPEGVSISSGDVIPAGATDSLLSLVGFGVRPVHEVVSILGIGTEAEPAIRRLALQPESIGEQRQPWFRTEMGLALTTTPPAVSIAWDDSDGALPIGYQRTVFVRVSQASKSPGPVRLSLISSQVPPKKPDGKDDVDRTLRLEGTPTFAADQTSGPVLILVPGDLPIIPYDVAIQAEVLSTDGKQVAARAETPSRRLLPAPAFALELASTNAVEARAGAGPTGAIVGRVVRPRGFAPAVTLTLAGLPADVLPPEFEVPAGVGNFKFPLSFPFLTPVGPLANVRLIGKGRVDATRVAQSNELPIAVTVAKGTSPGLLPIFEDESQFVGLLTEGDGAATLEGADRVSGSAALRVGKVQRYRSKLPGLGYKIAEKPGEGEYRYLRFAWKKKGGSNILLQLGVNDAFGPTKGTAGPGYRYEAGPGENPYNASAVRLDAKLPEQWMVVTRDLFADFGAFKFTGIALTPGEGEFGLFDHIYLARTMDDFKACPPTTTPAPPLAGAK